MALVGTLANNEAVVFRVGNIWLDDRQVISALLHDPNMTVEEALKKTNNSDENYGNDLKHTTLCDTIIHENVGEVRGFYFGRYTERGCSSA